LADFIIKEEIMFFKKKKAAGDTQDPIALITRAPRYSTSANVSINGFEGMAILRNVSSSGFCMVSRTYAALTPGTMYTLWLSPETDSNINTVELTVMVRWIRSTEHNFTVGFSVSKFPTDRSFEKYMNYVKVRNPIAV
jgi:hypothetical protein